MTQTVFGNADDDGVFVVSTRKNLVRLCPPKFDYAFPGVTLDGLRSSSRSRSTAMPAK